MTYQAKVHQDKVEKEGAIEIDMIHMYPPTMVKMSEYIAEATQTSKGWEDGHSSESNVRDTYIHKCIHTCIHAYIPPYIRT